ncbi:HD-GYP domain-containing protein [Clostridium sp. 19966]|uniref:HD-GYP domain-containing protein n=1 Tax=Clostridium sp. 19966 TaxID=2768166 RepID=UPI0028DD560D|nr:HD-GYP domain-containing protein [Clostridium sp. 19966]MDT8719105.1 HD-GYP domain-containing protein [Clostridium sp. 19966]
MRFEFINRVVSGEVLGKSILTSDGRVLLRAGVTLTSEYILKLRELGITYVYIEDDRLSDVPSEDEKLVELKKSAIKNMDIIMKNVNNYNKRQLKEAVKKIEELVDYVIESSDLGKYMADIKTHDNYTYLHSVDTGIMAIFMGTEMKYSEDKLKKLGLGGILHDIGKLKISNSIINKPGKLTEEEYEQMKNHPIFGADILKSNYRIPEEVIDIAMQHHERVDGYGYPRGLDKDNINKMANIVSLCDVYDAVVNDRSYRKKLKPYDAYELIIAASEVMFYQDVVLAFKNTFGVYPLGSCLKLSNGIEGYVIKQNKGFPDKPVIRVLYDKETKKPIPFYEINLSESREVVVDNII